MQRTNDRILMHEDQQRMAYRQFIATHLTLHGFSGRMPKQADAKGRLHPYVNHGRWVVDCPCKGCGGAVVVSRAEAFFLCPLCCNADNDGQWYRVEFPAHRAQIEIELLKRPVRPTRNWRAHESVADLRQENRAHGVKD